MRFPTNSKAPALRTALLALLLSFASNSDTQDHSILIGREAPAERVDAVTGGGHFPVMIRLDSGDLVAAVRAGATHIGVKGRLDWIRSKDNGKTWRRTTLIDTPLDDRNPAVGQLRDGTVIVAYHIAGGYGPNGEVPPQGSKVIRDGLYVLRSTDRGNTWEKPIKSEIPMELGASSYGKIIQLQDGTALMSVYYLKGVPYQHISYVYRSTDGGRTWGDQTKIADDFDETALVVLPKDRLIAVLRSKNGGFLSTSSSEDKGRTWSNPRQITANKEHPADVILLKDGRLLLTYGERNQPFGVRAKISRDLGVSWDPETIVLVADADTIDCGYPSSAEVGPGRIVTVYYGVNGGYDPYGKESDSLSRAYTRAVLWTLP
jgi:sialidase-1